MMDFTPNPAVDSPHSLEAPPPERRPLTADVDATTSGWRWATTAGGTLAAELALPLLMRWSSNRYQITTVSSEGQTLRLDADTQFKLNGDKTMAPDCKDTHRGGLDNSEAVVSVHYDPKDSSSLDIRISWLADVDTLMNLVSLAGQTRIALAEHAVDCRPKRQSPPWMAGER